MDLGRIDFLELQLVLLEVEQIRYQKVDRQGLLEVGPGNHQEVKQRKNQLGDQIGCLLGLDLLEVHQDNLDQIERVFQETAKDQYLRRKAVKEIQTKVTVNPNLKKVVVLALLAKDQEEVIKTNHLQEQEQVKQHLVEDKMRRVALGFQIKATEDQGQGRLQLYQIRERMDLVPGDKIQDGEMVILRKLEARHLEAKESSRSAAVASVLSLSGEKIQRLDFLLLGMRTLQDTQ